jgi:hypothetical protein
MTHALVQKLPREASDLEADRCGAVDVLAVGTEEQLEEFLEHYRRRLDAALDAACGEWNAWDAEAGSARRSLSGVIRTLSRHRPRAECDRIRTSGRSRANSSQLDSERFRSTPRTWGCFRGSFSVR